MLCVMCICPAIFSVVDPRHTALSLCFYPSVGDVIPAEARGNGIPPESLCITQAIASVAVASLHRERTGVWIHF